MTLNLSQMDQKKLEELARESNLLSTIDESYASMQTQNPSFDQGYHSASHQSLGIQLNIKQEPQVVDRSRNDPGQGQSQPISDQNNMVCLISTTDPQKDVEYSQQIIQSNESFREQLQMVSDTGNIIAMTQPEITSETAQNWQHSFLKLYSAESASNIMYSNEKQLLVAVPNHPCKFQLQSPPGSEKISQLVFSLHFQDRENNIPMEFGQNESCSCSNGVKEFLSASFEKLPTKTEIIRGRLHLFFEEMDINGVILNMNFRHGTACHKPRLVDRMPNRSISPTLEIQINFMSNTGIQLFTQVLTIKIGKNVKREFNKLVQTNTSNSKTKRKVRRRPAPRPVTSESDDNRPSAVKASRTTRLKPISTRSSQISNCLKQEISHRSGMLQTEACIYELSDGFVFLTRDDATRQAVRTLIHLAKNSLPIVQSNLTASQFFSSNP